jgi:lipopolysaccharide transport system permease protein
MSLFPGASFLVNSLVKNKRLLLEMTKRDISDRYAGQILGSFWAVIHPVMMISVYVFMFGVVFRTKVDSSITVPGDHTLYMLSGLVAWLVTADVLGRGSSIISGQAALVKQVVFPLEILPVKVVFSTLPTLCVGVLGLILYGVVGVGRAHWGFLLFPLAAVPLYLFLLGVAFLLSAVGVFLRDLKDIVQMYALIGLYVAPVFYFMDWVPKSIRAIIYLNPMTVFIECFHDAGYYGSMRTSVWVVACVLGSASFLIGATLFARLKPQFGSHL